MTNVGSGSGMDDANMKKGVPALQDLRILREVDTLAGAPVSDAVRTKLLATRG